MRNTFGHPPPPKSLKDDAKAHVGDQLHDYLALEIVDLLPSKTRVLLPSAVRSGIIGEAVTRFGGRGKLANYFKLNRSIPRWWEKGICRPSIAQLKMLGVSNDVISAAENFGLEGSKKSLKFPKEVIFDEEFAWFLGLRDGDPDETNFDVGVGNSDPTILRKVIHFFKKFFIQEEQLWLYISTTEANVNSVKERWSKELDIPKDRMRVYYQTKHLNKDYVKMRFSCFLFRLIIEKLRERLDTLLENSPVQVKAAYVRGFFDAEGCVEDFGIIVNQRANKKGLANLQRLDRLLTELGINHGKVRFTNKGKFAYVRIPAQSRAKNIRKFQEVVGFSSRNKSTKLSKLIQIYENGNSINRDLLKNRIPEWMNDKGFSLFNVMTAFCLKRSTACRTMYSLIKEGKIESKKVARKRIFIKAKTPRSSL